MTCLSPLSYHLTGTAFSPAPPPARRVVPQLCSTSVPHCHVASDPWGPIRLLPLLQVPHSQPLCSSAYLLIHSFSHGLHKPCLAPSPWHQGYRHESRKRFQIPSLPSSPVSWGKQGLIRPVVLNWGPFYPVGHILKCLRDICSCHSLAVVASDIECVEAREAAQHPTVPRTRPPTHNLVTDVNSAKGERLCFGPSHNLGFLGSF